MKVLHLSSEQSWRGGEQQIAYLIEELNAARIKTAVAVKRGSEFERYCKLNNIEYFSLSYTNSIDVKSALKLYHICRKYQPDLIHIHSSRSHGVAALATVFSLKTPMILSRRVDFPLKSNLFSKWKYQLTGIKKIICVSEAIRKVVENVLPKSDRILTIYSGISMEKFESVPANNTASLKKKFNLPENAILVGNTSALADHKDYFTFIDTARCLLHKLDNLFFFIIGEGPKELDIWKYIQHHNVADRVFMTGFKDDVPSVLNELDVFLMTSFSEGLGTSVLDAYASKTPVVSTDAGGLKEIVIHDETGLIAPVGSSEKLAENVLRLVENEQLRKRLIDNAHQFVQQFSKSVMAQKTIEVYEEVLKA